ncbi:BrnA antitoxin family protein [bacterium]|nr:BrnA antitoxin family protein [bacterium]
MSKHMKREVAQAPLEAAWEPLTAEEEAALESACANDEEIDLSGTPEITDEQWATAARGNDMWRPKKIPVSARLDADVLHWLKRSGPGYLTRINQILREAMMNSGHTSKRR